MDYLSVDFTAFPLRAMRSTLVSPTRASKKLVIKEIAAGPPDKKEEGQWLRHWIKTQRRWLTSTPFLGIWDSPFMNTRIQAIEQVAPVPPEQPADIEEENRGAPVQAKAWETEDSIIYHCSLSHQDPQFEFRVQLPRAKDDALVEYVSGLYPYSKQITVLPLAIWSAFLVSYPDCSDKTVAIAWRAREVLVLIVVRHGQLVFCRHFATAALHSDAWIMRIEESLEHFSFLFPTSQVDLVLFGGDSKNQEEARKWIENSADCACEWIAPFHSEQISVQSKRPVDDKEWPAYWSCMGLVWGHALTWQ